ncbi:MAG: PAS domain S-box protein, partial [Nitrospira sp.]|nr:PAS domain S-box protein [Nitrospira sp.]
MAKKPGESTKMTGLRSQAEESLRVTKRDIAAMPVKDVQQLVHELQVHQVELEMQNDELRRAQIELEVARDRFVDLYDFSPAGHLSLDLSGTIVEANLRAGALLGVNRKELIKQPFERFVASDDRDVFDRHRQEIIKTGTRHTCEVRLWNKASAYCLSLESLAVHEEPERITHWQMALLDISSRKRAEQEKTRLVVDLARSREHFKSLFNWTPSAVGISTVAEGRFIDVNEGFSRLTGYTREEVIGRTTLELGLWADPSERAIVFRELQEQGSLHNREGLLRTKSGEIRDLMVSVEPIQLGSTPCLIYLGHDITERKRAEGDLRLAKFMMDRAADAVYWIDPQAKILDANEAAGLMLGYSKDELCAMTVHDLNPDFQANIWPGFWAETRKRTTMVIETFHKAKNGRLIPIEVAVNFLSYEGKEYHCVFARDITERKRAEEALRRSEAFITSVVENLPSMIFVKDAKDLTFISLNKAGEALLGRSREDVIGRSDYDFFPKEEAEFFTIIDRQVLKTGSLLDIPEEPIETKHQGRRLLHTKKIPMYDDKGTPQYLLGISEDIT